MRINIGGGGDVAVAQPRLDIFGITAAFAKGIDRAVPQIMKPAWTSVGFHNPLKMVRDKIRVKRSTIGLCADVTGINILLPPKPLVFGLPLLYLQKIGPHCSRKRKVAPAGGRLGIVRKDDFSFILHRSVANIEGPGIKIYRFPFQAANLTAAHSIGNC